jgi:hypothetical protein
VSHKGGGDVLTIGDVRARLARLEELSRGLTKERTIIRAAEDELLYLERRKYLCALEDARFGVESAKMALAKALSRIEGKGAGEAA